MKRAFLSGVVAVIVVGCAAAPGSGDIEGEVLVSAAASLTDAFRSVEAAFEDLHPDVDVILNFGPSSGLRTQIVEGAPVDVFASADTANMDAVADEWATEPSVFATNRLAIAVPAGNPAGVGGLADLARDDLLIGLCAEGDPCGEYARTALASAGVVASVDTAETDVRALLDKIAAGELDAGIVYWSDVRGNRSVEDVAIPAEHDVVASYPIAVLSGAPNPAAARAFVEFVLSLQGQGIMSAHGLGSP